ncbi:MAG: histidine triad nucleotide-binding protein [Acidimicrobiia bacterium]
MDDCLFCRIAKGEIESNKVLDRGGVIAFRDINPQAPTHIQIIPKEHVKDMTTLTEAHSGLLAEIFVAAKELAESEGLNSGFRVVANVGPDAGQSVFHLHFHLIGGRQMGWPPG